MLFCFSVPKLRPRQTQMKTVPKIRTKKDTTKSLAHRRPKSMPSRCQAVEIGQVVLFKLTGYCEWPASVTQIDDSMAHIQFYGDRTIQKSKITNFYKFEDSLEIILFNLRSRKTQLYKKAVREAEIDLGIPEHSSILNQI